MVYPYKWLLINCRSGAGQRKFASQRPTFYHWAAPVTGHVMACKRSCPCSLLSFVYVCQIPTLTLPPSNLVVRIFDNYAPGTHSIPAIDPWSLTKFWRTVFEIIMLMSYFPSEGVTGDVILINGVCCWVTCRCRFWLRNLICCCAAFLWCYIYGSLVTTCFWNLLLIIEYLFLNVCITYCGKEPQKVQNRCERSCRTTSVHWTHKSFRQGLSDTCYCWYIG